MDITERFLNYTKFDTQSAEDVEQHLGCNHRGVGVEEIAEVVVAGELAAEGAVDFA